MIISIHALREEGDCRRFPALGSFLHFYPRPPRGGRLHMRGMAADIIVFLSTPSARRATSTTTAVTGAHSYFYPRPPRGGRPVCPYDIFQHIHFYPRPPRGGRLKHFCPLFKISGFLSTPSARRATPKLQKNCLTVIISIHALREEGDSKNREKTSAFVPL